MCLYDPDFDFDYIPKGSVAILPGAEIVCLTPLAPELQERLKADLQKLIQRTKERNAQGLYATKDYH